MKRVAILALKESTPSGVLVVHDLFRLAGFEGGARGENLFETRVVSEDGTPLSYSSLVEIVPQRSVDSCGQVDLVVIPSGGYRAKDLTGYSGRLTQWLRHQYLGGADIAAVCTGVFLLAASGLLDGRRATTHWAFAELMRTLFPEVRLMADEIVTEDGRLYCSGGGTAGMDLMLYLIEGYYGPGPARYCSSMMLLDRGRDAQTPYRAGALRVNHSDDAIHRAQNYIEGKFTESFVLDEVADHVGMSLRNFKRRFKNATGETPLAYLQRLRVERARKELEHKAMRIEDLAATVGYEDLGFFRKLFVRHTGVSPSDYRQRFKNRCS